MSDKIRVGFVGAGYMGQVAHIRNYAQLPDECELVAVADLRTGLAERVAERYGIGDVYADHTEMLAKADIDAVVAIMGYQLHHMVVPDILRAGKHLLTEKPIGTNAATAREWRSIADDAGVVYLVGYMKRWDLGSRYVSDLIADWRASGEFGAFKYLRCLMSGTDWMWSPERPLMSDEQPEAQLVAEPFPSALSETEAKFYNMNINFYVHQVNLIRFLLGEDYDLTYAHSDGTVLLATTDSGAAITLEMSVYGINQTWDEVYHICFEGADIELRVPAPLQMQRNAEVVVRRNVADGTHETLRPNLNPPSWSFFEQAKGFLGCIRDGRIPYDSAGDAVRDLEIFERQVALVRDVGGKMDG